MIKPSGCLNSTSTEALEALTNSQPIDLQLKLRQAQEVVRIGAIHPDDPLRANGQKMTRLLEENLQYSIFLCPDSGR